MRRVPAVTAALLALASGWGCYTGAATSLASDERKHRTGIESGDGVALWIASAERCRTSDPVSEGECEPRPVADLEPGLTSCLRDQLGGAELVRALDALGAPPAGAESEALVAWLSGEDVQRRASTGRVRYLIALRVRTSEGGFPSGGNASLGWVIARAEERTTRIQAEVMDVAKARAPGTVSAKAYGPSGKGVLFALGFIPIPLIQDAKTERAACEAAAKTIAKFLRDPEPRKWLPEP